jgi:PAS domain S-box-containing protein
VVAEGVETEAQAQALAGLGCTRAQGWLYAKALESADVPALLARGAPPLGPARRATEVVAHASRAHQVVVTDAQGRTVFVNAAFTLNTGYTLADMAGRSPGSVLQGADTDPAAVHVLREAVRSGVGCMGVEIVNHRKDGSPFAVRLDIEPVRDASGKVLEFVSVQTEVSELRQVRSDLATIRRREDEIRALGIVGFWERDLRTGQARWDNNTRRMLGRLAHEAELGWAEALAACTPETRPALQAYIDALSAGQTSGVLEYTLVHRDGREVDLLSRWRREGDRILGITVDVSGGTRRRNAAQVQLHLMALATEAAQQLCWVADLASDRLEWLGTSRLAAWDALRACEDWGQLLQRVLPQDRTRLLTARAAALKGSDSVELEFGIELAGGEVLSLQSRQCALRDAAGHAQHLVGVLMDITPRFRQPVRLRELERRHDIEHAAAGQGVFRFDVAAQRFDVD